MVEPRKKDISEFKIYEWYVYGAYYANQLGSKTDAYHDLDRLVQIIGLDERIPDEEAECTEVSR